MKITTIGLDIAKNVFHMVEISRSGRVLNRKMLRRAQLLAFFANHDDCVVVMETCSGANHWAR